MTKEKIMQRMFIGVLALILLVGSAAPSFATESLESMVSRTEMLNLLVENGAMYEIADNLDDEQLERLYFGIKESNSVEIGSGVVEVNNLEELENFVSADKADLIEAGYTETQIEEAQQTVEELFSMNNEELASAYGLNDVEINLIREIKQGTSEETKEENLDVEASGTISSSKLTFNFYKMDQSTSKKPKYEMTAGFYWWDVPFLCLTDYIALSWGGGLNVTEETGKTKYWSLDNNGDYSKQKETHAMTTTETIQKGMKFGIRMVKNGYTAKTGTASCILSQSKFQGLDSKVIAQYGHKKVKVDGVSITIGAPGISFGTAYDKSPQEKFAIKY